MICKLEQINICLSFVPSLLSLLALYVWDYKSDQNKYLIKKIVIPFVDPTNAEIAGVFYL